jgi:hypothetical protein
LKEVITSIEIRSNPENIWNVLTDFPNYKYWNPYIVNIVGFPTKGQRIEIELRTVSQKTRTYRPIITKVKPPTELRWRGKAILPLILDGEHVFMIRENEKDTSIFTQKEIFKGIGIYFGSNNMLNDIRESFESMNLGLKRRMEKKAS